MTTSLEIEPVMNMSNSAEEQQQCAVSWDQHWIQSESMLLLYLMTSHILWLFTAILEVTFCDFLQLFWKSQIVSVQGMVGGTEYGNTKFVWILGGI